MKRKGLAIIIFFLLIVLNIFFVFVYLSQPTSSGTTADLNGVAWRPDDSFALIVGGQGTVLKYDGDTFSEVPNVPTEETLWDVAWAPDGRHAVIVGEKGAILLYDNSRFMTIDSGSSHALLGVTWFNNTLAYIVGGVGTVFILEDILEKWELRELPPRTSQDLQDIDWFHVGGYGLIVGKDGLVLQENGTDYMEFESGTNAYLRKVAWRPFSEEALIIGNDGTAILFTGSDFDQLDTGVSDILTGISWKPDGKSALVVGDKGLMLRFDGEEFSQESSATSGYLGDVEWKHYSPSAILVGQNGIVRIYPNMGLSPEFIVMVWYAELALGALLVILIMIDLFSSREKRILVPKKPEPVAHGEVKVGSSVEYNQIYLFYTVKIKNRSSFPISDITVKPYLSNDLFILDEDTKNISLIRPDDTKIAKFWVRPKREVHGEADIVGRVDYYDPATDGYKDQLLKPRIIKAVWPELTSQKIESWRWEAVMDTLQKIEKTISNVPLSGRKCSEFARGIISSKNMNTISTNEVSDEGFLASATFYGVGRDNEKYGLGVRVSAQEEDAIPSQIAIDVYAEDNASLVGLYHTIFDDINKGLEYIEKDFSVLRHMADLKSRIKKGEVEAETGEISEIEADASQKKLIKEFNEMRKQIDSIEKDKLGVDSRYTSLYELDELYKILAEDLGEDFPSSGKKAILLVYFNAMEVYVRGRLKELIPKGVTILLGEGHGHINTRKKDWEKTWFALSLGSLIHVVNNNRYLFLKNEELWDRKVETLMHQVRELRNTVAHPSKANPDPKLVRNRVYTLFKVLPDVLKDSA
jgi:WD40 repeat protein